MPNATVLEQKKAEVAALARSMSEAPSGVLVDYKGITVAQDTKLRAELRKAGVDYKVVKNTLMQRAVVECGLDELTNVLSGTTALAVAPTDDMVAPARILVDYAKKSGNKFTIKAGFIEGRAVSAGDVNTLAELPSRDQLIANVLAGFNAPIAGFVNVLNGNLRGLAVALNAIAEKKAAE